MYNVHATVKIKTVHCESGLYPVLQKMYKKYKTWKRNVTGILPYLSVNRSTLNVTSGFKELLAFFFLSYLLVWLHIFKTLSMESLSVHVVMIMVCACRSDVIKLDRDGAVALSFFSMRTCCGQRQMKVGWLEWTWPFALAVILTLSAHRCWDVLSLHSQNAQRGQIHKVSFMSRSALLLWHALWILALVFDFLWGSMSGFLKSKFGPGFLSGS